MEPDAADITPTGRQPHRRKKELESAPFDAHCRSDDRDYGQVAIEDRISNVRQSDAGLSHQFQTRRGKRM